MKKIKLLQYIYAHNKEVGWPPTVREIQAKFGMSSTSVSVYWIGKTANAGLIERDSGIARGLRITEKGYKALMAAEEKS
jgi:SOS-response transcriptional repressor LexA